MSFNLILLLYILVFFLFFFQVLLNKPHYIIYFVVFNIFSGIDPLLPGFSLRTYLLALLVFIDLMREVKYKNEFHDYEYRGFFSKDFKWIYYFIFWAVFVDIFVALFTGVSSINDLTSAIIFFIKALISWYLIIFFFQKYINSESKLHATFYIALFSILIPIILAITQYVGLSPSIKLAALLSNYPEEVFSAIGWERFSGNITPFFVFGYLLLSVFFLNMYLILKPKTKLYVLHFFISILIFLGLMINQTRSAIFAIFIGLCYVIFKTRKEIFGKFILFSLSLVVIIFLFNFDKVISSSERLNIIKYRHEQSVLQRSISSRINLFKASLNLIIKKPIGVGRTNYREEIDEFGGVVNPKYYDLFQTTTAHNQFLTIGAFYGIPSIIFMVFLYVYFFRKLSMRVLKKDNLNILKYCFIGWLIAYILNGQVHNAYPYGSKYVALLFGMIYTFLNLKRSAIIDE